MLPISWLGTAAALMGCSPTLDWREVRPEGSGALAMFPCKPSIETRSVALAGAPVRMSMAVCRAGGATFGLAFADLQDPSRVAPALQAWREASAANLGAAVEVVGPLQVPGMTPNPQAQRTRARGQMPDGAALSQDAAYFTRGTWVFQATVTAPGADRDAVDAFFGGLKLPS